MVTGAGGFLGRHLVSEVVRQQMPVVAVSSREPDELGLDGSGTTVITPDQVGRVPWDSVSCLINSGFPRVWHGRELADGLLFQRELLSCAADAGVRRVVNISSQSIYDPAREHPAAETDTPALTTPYATAKFAQELLADALLTSAEIVHIRLASLIGAGFDQRVVNKMVHRAIDTGEISAIDNGQVFDFMDVRDAASAIVSLCVLPLAQRRNVVNVGGLQPRTLPEIAEAVRIAVRQELGQDVAVTRVAAEHTSVSSALDCGQLAQTFGFRPMYSLNTTIRQIIRHHAAVAARDGGSG